MLLRIDHETTLRYSEPVAEAIMELRMAPQSNEDQTVLGYRPRITPQVPLTSSQDGFGNRIESFNLIAPHREVFIRTSSCVRLHRRDGASRAEGVTAEQWGEDLEAFEFTRTSPLTQSGDHLLKLVESIGPISGDLRQAGEKIMHGVRGRMAYEKAVTNASTPMSQALELGRGVCQDFAHVFIGVCRLKGIACRYVSGYVHQPGELATHAWCQMWGGTAVGWVDIDPTHEVWPGNDHVVTAVGRDFDDVPPNRGVWKSSGAEESMIVNVQVQPVDRLPTDLTDPTTAPAWTNAAPTVPRVILPPDRNRMNQQQRRPAYRQQQSQQQQ